MRADVRTCGDGSNRLCPSSAEDRKRLLAIVADRNRPLKHVRRAHVVLCSADCLPVQEVARRARVSRPAVWRWQARYAEQGVEGLLRDKTRKPGRAPLSAKVVAKVLDLDLLRAAGPGDALDRAAPWPKKPSWRQPARRSALVGGAPAAAAPHSAVLQALQRSRRSTARSRACRLSPENAGR